MKQKAEHRSVTLFWILVLTVFVLMSGFTVIRFVITKQRMDEALLNRAENVAMRIVDAIAPTIWDIYRKSENRVYSKEVSSAVLDAEFRDPFVLGVVVYGNFGHVHMARFRDGEDLLEYDGDIEKRIQSLADLDFYEPVKNGPMTIGNVRVYLSSEPNREFIKRTLIVDAVEALSVSILIVACLFFILRKALIRPMRTLSIARHAIESLGEAVIVTDRNGIVIDVNLFYCRLFEQSRDAIVGQPLGLKVDGGAEALDAIWKGKSVDRVWSGEARVSTDKGRWKYVYANVSPVISEEGESDYTVAVLQGIEELKRAEEVLKIRNRELEFAKDRAEASSRAKDEFLSIMSHELRTPLNPIIGFGNLINDELEDPDLLEQMGVVLDSATHLLRLIESVLEYTKLERDPSLSEVTVFDYRRSCERLMNAVRLDADKKSLQLSASHRYVEEFSGREGRFDVVADQTKFEQILLNFLVNAVKFTESGSVSIETELSLERLLVSVRDTGVGIGEENLEKVFQAFTQVDSTLRRKHEGIGLGLAISRKLAEVMSGEIRCESEIGVGTVLYLDIPVDIALSNVLVEERPEEDKVHSVEGKRVLVVEDDVENLRLVRIQLEKLGYSVLKASSGPEAIEEANRTKVDVILMDLQMDGMDGFRASKEIRSTSKQNKETPVIAFTAHGSAITEEQCKERGMSDFIAKPYRVSELEEKLRRWCW